MPGACWRRKAVWGLILFPRITAKNHTMFSTMHCFWLHAARQVLSKKKRIISVKAIHALELLQEVCSITSETLCKASFLNCATSIYRNHIGLRRLKGHVTYPSVGKANPCPAHVSTNEKPVPLHHVFIGAKLGRRTGIWSRPAPNCDGIIYLGKLELVEERPPERPL